MTISNLKFVRNALFRTKGMMLFNVTGTIGFYDKTRRSKPSNFNQIMSDSAANRYFAEAREKKIVHFGSIISLGFGTSS
jgi:hypothetical protein